MFDLNTYSQMNKFSSECEKAVIMNSSSKEMYAENSYRLLET